MTPYKFEDGKLVRDDSNAISVSSSKRELFSSLCVQVDRAESAEQRAAQLEADLLRYQADRVALLGRIDELVAEVGELRERINSATLTAMAALTDEAQS